MIKCSYIEFSSISHERMCLNRRFIYSPLCQFKPVRSAWAVGLSVIFMPTSCCFTLQNEKNVMFTHSTFGFKLFTNICPFIGFHSSLHLTTWKNTWVKCQTADSVCISLTDRENIHRHWKVKQCLFFFRGTQYINRGLFSDLSKIRF